MQIIENSFNFQRFLLEAGLSIGGAVATGGATSITYVSRTAGMLSKPFFARLALTAGGSAVGGGTGAGLAQTFDPRGRCITRNSKRCNGRSYS